MSYDPSHRKPPHQERWPQATPPDGWPSYRDDDAHRHGQQADSRYEADDQGAFLATAGYRRQAAGYQGASGGPDDRGYQSAVATDTFPPARNGYGSAVSYGAADSYSAADGYGGLRGGYTGTVDGYLNAADGYADAGDSFAGGPDRYSRTEAGYGQAADEYTSDASGYDWSGNGYGTTADDHAGALDGYPEAADGYAGVADGFAGAPDDFAGQTNYLDPGSYTEPGLSDPRLVAPDVGIDPYRWRAEQGRRREAGRRGLIVGAVTGFLAAAVAIGVSTLAAGFVRPQASPMAALGSVFIDRMPTALRNVALQHFGAHGRTVLLLGMYIAIAVLAVGIGVLARHAAAPGAASLAAFSLIAAFVTITRPGGRVSDVAPAIIGGIAGVAALLWLMRASAPIAPQRPARSGARRRA